MYLSRIQLNPARRDSRKLLGSPQAMHAAVLASFREPDDVRGRALWRVDRDGTSVWLYVASRPRPDFTHIVEQAGWPATEHGWESRPYEPLLDRLARGQTWAFRLTANPTRTTRAAGPARSGVPSAPRLPGTVVDSPSGTSGKSRRYGHVTVDQQIAWFRDRAEGWGLRLPAPDRVVVRDRHLARFRRGEATVTIARATFDGVLEVAEPTLLRDVLIDGAGPAKAYGCGLMTLALVS